MRQGSGVRRLVLVAAALTGVVAAHALDYATVIADRAERAHHLHATGHGYWSAAIALGVGAAAVAAAAAVWWGARRSLDRKGGPAPAPLIRLAPLAAVQVGLFTTVEVGERLLAGAGLADLLHGPLFPLGIGLQVVVAAAAVLVLRLVASGAGRVAARADRRPRRARPERWVTAAVAAPVGGVRAAAGCRGPPAPNLS